jgi:hypothetical protein
MGEAALLEARSKGGSKEVPLIGQKMASWCSDTYKLALEGRVFLAVGCRILCKICRDQRQEAFETER